MPTNPNKLSQFWHELKRRKVIHVIIVYATVAFVIIELVNNVYESLQLPDWTPTLVLLLLVIGFPFAIIFSWIYDISLKEIKKTEPVEHTGKKKADKSQSDNPSRFENSIAVLPFEDMSPQKDQEYFCDGITEELINVLAHVESLKVIARTSSFAFKGKQKDMREIGRKLDVETLLEGSIRKDGNRLRITAQLIKVTDGSHLWSEKFDREIEDVFAIQDEISLSIVENLKTRLLNEEKKVILKHHTENSEIYSLYLLGRFNTNKRNTESLDKAINYYEDAIRLDPNFALAYAGLSEAYNLCALGYSALPSTETFPKAKEAALKAIEIDGELAEAHTSLAFTKQYFEFDWPVIEQEYLKAIELNPGYAPARQWYGEYLFIHKRWDESQKEILKALELDPLSYIIRNELGWFYHYQDKIDKAIKEYMKVIEMAPDYAVAYFNMGTAYLLEGNSDEAIKYGKKSVELSGGSLIMKAGLAYVYAQSGEKNLAIEIRDEMIKLTKSGYMCFGSLAMIYVGLNERDEAVKCMESAFLNKESWMYFIRMFYENYLGTYLVSDDLRFMALQKKLGLE